MDSLVSWASPSSAYEIANAASFVAQSGHSEEKLPDHEAAGGQGNDSFSSWYLVCTSWDP